MQRQFKKDKIKVLLNSGVDSCEVVGDEVVSTLSDGKKVNTQYVLVAIGRRPNIENSGIEELGIELNRGKIVVNENLETSVEGIYAIGDLINTPMLAHVASKEGIIAVENAFGKSKTVDYTAVPRCVYTCLLYTSCPVIKMLKNGHYYIDYLLKINNLYIAKLNI